MTRLEFQIGMEFECGERRWRCTDIGTRVIVAIELVPARNNGGVGHLTRLSNTSLMNTTCRHVSV